MTFLLFILIVGSVILCVSIFTRRFGFRHLEYHLRFTESEVNEGDEVTLIETICSRKLLPLPWVKAELTTDASLQFAAEQSSVSEDTRFISSFFCLFPYRQIERRWKVRCTKRGVFSVSHAVLVISDLFSTMELSQPFPQAKAELTVLPAVRAIESLLPEPLQGTGNQLRHRMLIPDRFAVCGIRAYQEGDALRDLCLTASLRVDTPMVWQYQETAVQVLTILLNLETRETDREQVSDREIYENEIRLCAAFLGEAAKEQIPVRICANAEIERLPVDSGTLSTARELRRLLRILAALPFQIAGSFRRLLNQTEADTSVVIITSQISRDILLYAAAHPQASVYSLRPLREREMLDNTHYIHFSQSEEQE